MVFGWKKSSWTPRFSLFDRSRRARISMAVEARPRSSSVEVELDIRAWDLVENTTTGTAATSTEEGKTRTKRATTYNPGALTLPSTRSKLQIPLFATPKAPIQDGIKMRNLLGELFAKLVNSHKLDLDASVPQWVLLVENEQNITRDTDTARIMGASLEMLVQELCNPKEIDLQFVDTLLGTFRSFVEPIKLFVLLLRCIYGSDDESKCEIMRLQAHFALRRWIESHPCDFDSDSTLMSSTLALTECFRNSGNNILAIQLENNLKRVSRRPIPVAALKAPAPRLPPLCASWWDIDPLELARQLTIMEAEMYCLLERTEFLSCAWSKPKLRHLAPHVLETIDHFNRLSMFVVGEIVRYDTVVRRRAVYERVVAIMQCLLDLSNFNTLMALMAGLSNAAIFRLKATRSELSRKTVASLSVIEPLMTTAHNYKLLRAELESRVPPKLPYLGMYLSDLTFIAQGVPDILKSGLINFEKSRQEHAVITNILKNQNFPFNLVIVPRIQQIINDLPTYDTETTYRLSLKHEPRTQ
eukprot:c6394_g1_i1.p1 GENE.c6394_g1_i1~~c6394_g1_i1.p1  ORF type:complete len:528 (-),score=114.25 c6394_g1_i1:209-1792(-)